MTPAETVARERWLDAWLEEALGAPRAAAPAAAPRRWLAAAIALLAAGAAVGVAWLRRDDAAGPVQEPTPAVVWTEAHGPAALASIPADVVNLRCFDFDDAALARLAAGFPRLERLDLSGMDVDERGVSVSLPITDAGLTHLGALTRLRWLSLAECHAITGEGLRALEALPRLESLDLAYSGVTSSAIERLDRLGNLHELSLSHCLDFHGRSLAAVARIPGLRVLRLQGCATVAAEDAMVLAGLQSLRHLDLRDCQGRFRGQTSLGPGASEDDPPPPVQDGVGITDAVVAALAALPLETLRLGGCESLTDAIGDALARMRTLRRLDLSNLPHATGALLRRLPADLEELWLDDNVHFQAADLERLPRLPRLHTLGWSGLPIDAPLLERLFAGRALRGLHLGGASPVGKADGPARFAPLPAGCAALLAQQQSLEALDLRHAAFVDRDLLAAVATLPNVQVLDLTVLPARPLVDRSDAVRGLAANRSLRELRLAWNGLSVESLRALEHLPLRELDLYGSSLRADTVRAVAVAWPGCKVRLPEGGWWQVPDRR